MTMRLSVKQLRKLILREMKLGIAGAEGDARAWGKKPLPDDPPPYEPPEGGETYIATDIPDFDPGPEITSLYKGHGHVHDMAGDTMGDSDPEMAERPTVRKLEARKLRALIREELAAEPDPFADPNKKKPADLRSLAKNVLQAEEILGSMPQVLGEMEASTKIPKARAMLKKAAGLAYHAQNDLKALEAVLTIAVKEMRKN